MKTMSNDHAQTSIMVFWDIEDCKIPNGLNVGIVANNIKTALREAGYSGNVSIMAYGKTNHIKNNFRSAGVTPNHVAGDKPHRHKKILIDVYDWERIYPEDRSNVMLAMGDMSQDLDFIRDLASLKLRRKINILLSQPPPCASGAILSVATKVWRWTSLAFGGAPL